MAFLGDVTASSVKREKRSLPRVQLWVPHDPLSATHLSIYLSPMICLSPRIPRQFPLSPACDPAVACNTAAYLKPIPAHRAPHRTGVHLTCDINTQISCRPHFPASPIQIPGRSALSRDALLLLYVLLTLVNKISGFILDPCPLSLLAILSLWGSWQSLNSEKSTG